MSEKYSSLTEDGFAARYGDHEAVLVLVRKYGIWNLGGDNGCLCAHFSLCGINVDVSCHKSEHCIRVHNQGITGGNVRGLEVLANEIVIQLRKEGSRGYRVRYCAWEHDHVNGRWKGDKFVEDFKCCYCGSPRPDRESYLCPKCTNDHMAIAYYPWGLKLP